MLVTVTGRQREQTDAPVGLPRGREPGMAAWRAFLDAHAAIMRRLELELDAEQALSLADFDVLFQLSSATEHGLRMSDLAERVLLSRSGMTRRVDRLESAGLVARRGCDADRRGAYAVVTRAGLDRLAAAVPTHLRGVDEHFLAHLAPDETALIASVLGRLAARAVGTTRNAADCLPADGSSARTAKAAATTGRRGD